MGGANGFRPSTVGHGERCTGPLEFTFPMLHQASDALQRPARLAHGRQLVHPWTLVRFNVCGSIESSHLSRLIQKAARPFFEGTIFKGNAENPTPFFFEEGGCASVD